MAEGAPSPMEGGMGDEGLEMHMRSLIKAFEKKDPRALATAMRAAVHKLYMEYESGDSEMTGGGMPPSY